MKIIHFDKKNNVAKVRVDCLDDLWHLSKIIEKGDLVAGRIERKIKVSEEGERARTDRRGFFAIIKAEKIKPEANALRVLGEIVGGTDELPLGSSHALDITPGVTIKIEKDWKQYQIRRLLGAEKASSAPKAIICALDDEQAVLAALTSAGIKQLGEVKLGLIKKRTKEDKQAEKLEKLADEIIRLDTETNPDAIIIASPIFWKENLLKVLKEKEPRLVKKAKLEDVSTGGRRALAELINRGVLTKIIKDSEIQKEFQLVNDLLLEISKDGLAEYGFERVKAAVESGAVKELLITSKRLADNREEISNLIDLAEQQKSEVHIVDSGDEAGEKLDGLGGIAALLRFKI